MDLLLWQFMIIMGETNKAAALPVGQTCVFMDTSAI